MLTYMTVNYYKIHWLYPQVHNYGITQRRPLSNDDKEEV